MPNILIVDDDEGNLILLEAIVTNLKINVIKAFSGREALEKTRGIELALAIIDVMMPEMDGHELAIKLNEERSNEKVPIIFLTANYFTEKDIFKGYASGAIDYIIKPVNPLVIRHKTELFLDLFMQKQTIKKNVKLLQESTDKLLRSNIALKESEEKYQNYINNAPDGIFVTDENGNYIEANHAASEITGYTKEELLKMSVSDMLPKESLDDGLSHFQKVVDIGTSKSDLLCKHKNGTKRWLSLGSVKLSGTRFLCFVNDITKRHQEKEQIINSAKKFRVLIDDSPLGIYYSDLYGNFLYGNKRAEEIAGFSLNEMIGQNFLKLKLLAPKDILRATKLLVLNRIGKATGPDYFKLNAKGGIKKRVEISTSVIHIQGEKFVLGIVQDITERIRAEKAKKKSETKFRTLFKTMVHGVVYQDKDGRVISANAAAERILGLSLDQMQGCTSVDPAWRSIHEDGTDFPGETHPAMLALRMGKPVNNVIMGVFNPKLKEHTWIRINAVPLYKPKKRKPYQVHTTFEDITERKHAEEEYQTIIKTATDGFWIVDKEGRFVDVNSSYCHMIGYSREELLNMSVAEVEDKEDIKTIQKNIQRVIKSGTACFETRHRCKNGKTIDMEISANYTPLHGGRFYVFLRDITERNKAKQELKVSETKYKTMLNASPDGILLLNLKGTITEVSEIGLELLGTENKEELISKHFMRFISVGEKDVVRKAIEKTIYEGLAQNFELKIRKKNGTVFLSETSSTLIQGTDSMPFSYMITIRDISHRKKMERKLIHADRMASLGEMASGIAHEINQPLNTISLALDNVLYEASVSENFNDEYIKKKSDRIFESISRIRNIIDHVKAFSKSHDDFILTGFDINTSIGNAISMIAEQFKHMAITLDLQLEENLPKIIGNTLQFEQVILNLLSNAKDALLEKKKKHPTDFDMSVKIKSFQENQLLIVEITDNGIGINEEEIDQVMLPFYTTKETGTGTGLGLSISYQIIKEMKGTIEITSKKFYGTTFKIIFNSK